MPQKRKKRTYQTEVTAPADLRLQPRPDPRDAGASKPGAPNRLNRRIFSPELILRLTERIKDL